MEINKGEAITLLEALIKIDVLHEDLTNDEWSIATKLIHFLNEGIDF